MKHLILAMLILIVMKGQAADTKPLPATINGVAPAKDERSLIVRYELGEKPYELKLTFTNSIAEFRYCPWMGTAGIAVVAKTVDGNFFYKATYLRGTETELSAMMLPAPSGKNHLLGIANSGGDSIVISGLQHRRDNPDPKYYGPDRLSGWMFIDNCPRTGMTGGIGGGLLIPFDLTAPIPKKPTK